MDEHWYTRADIKRVERRKAVKRRICFLLCFAFFASVIGIGAYADNRDTIVYVTLSGEKYHKESCSSIKNSRLLAITLEEATYVGYNACKKCKPAEADFSTYGWPEVGVLPSTINNGISAWLKPDA